MQESKGRLYSKANIIAMGNNHLNKELRLIPADKKYLGSRLEPKLHYCDDTSVVMCLLDLNTTQQTIPSESFYFFKLFEARGIVLV